jgi:hypothetical protein
VCLFVFVRLCVCFVCYYVSNKSVYASVLILV